MIPIRYHKKRNFDREFASAVTDSLPGLELRPGSRVAVIGGGPAGSFFSYFLLNMAWKAGLNLELDIYEPRDFSQPGPAGCNMCGGIISESLVQTLAADGIHLPPTVIERGIDSYILHTDLGSVRIDTPLHEKRIGAVHRGAGPRGMKEAKWRSFDGYLLELAQGKGARVVRERVEDITWTDGHPQVTIQARRLQGYDLLAVAIGVNSSLLKRFEKMELGYQPPQTTKTYIAEFFLGQETVERCLGSSMHIFLLDVPRLEFAALVPKGDYATVCLLGQEVDDHLVESFLNSPQVRHCLPADWNVPTDFCHCSPRINVEGARQPFADRLVFIGDCGVTRLYKDGIGSAYRTAKAAAVTAVFAGISAEDFRRRYWPACRAISKDNKLGKLIFAVTRLFQKRRPDRRGVLRMVTREQQSEGSARRMSIVLWDVFTGSAPYKEVFRRALHPFFLGRFIWEVIAGIVIAIWPFNKTSQKGDCHGDGSFRQSI